VILIAKMTVERRLQPELDTMTLPDQEIIQAVYGLLPGFISAWIFFSCTAHSKPDAFERVVQALIFTLFCEAIVIVLGAALCFLGDKVVVLGEWTKETAFTWKVGVAVILGLVFSYSANTNWCHRKLFKWGITQRTSYPSEWYSAFKQRKTRIYLHLKDGRRLYGWPEEWPDEPQRGQFLLSEAEWILPDNQRIPLLTAEAMLVQAMDVEFVEFERPVEKGLADSEQVRQTTELVVAFNKELEEELEPKEKNHE
jgi:hypothetical protein